MPGGELTQALNFGLDVQEAILEGGCLKEVIRTTLENYPGAVVGEDIVFTDGSKAILTTEGFKIK